MSKLEKIAQIKENLEKIGININCSRFENSYDGYCDSRDWYFQYADKHISLDIYLNGIDENILDKMIESI